MTVGKTTKEQRDEITKELSRYLNVQSPFSVWSRGDEPVIAISRLDNIHRSGLEIELYQLKGMFSQSDFFYLMAASCYQYATGNAISALLRFWNRKDKDEASKDKRESIIVPNPEDFHATRIRTLCSQGVMNRYDCVLNPDIYPPGNADSENTIIPVYRSNGIGNSIYKAALEKKPVPYNLQTAFYTESEILRWTQNSVLTAAFLNLPYINDVKFLYGVKVNKKPVIYMSYLEVTNNTNPKRNCHLILESVVLTTNEKIVTKKSRIESFRKRVVDLLGSLDVVQRETGRTHILVFCVEDAEGLLELQKVLSSYGGMSYASRILVTSGTVLYGEELESPQSAYKMKNAFLEYDGVRFQAAIGYYFLFDQVLNTIHPTETRDGTPTT